MFLSDSSKTSPAKTPKKIKVEVYKLTKEQKALIKNDEANKKVWDEAMESLSLGPVRMAIYLVKLNLMFWGNSASVSCMWMGTAAAAALNQAWNINIFIFYYDI